VTLKESVCRYDTATPQPLAAVLVPVGEGAGLASQQLVFSAGASCDRWRRRSIRSLSAGMIASVVLESAG